MSRELTAGEITATAMGLVEDLSHLQALDAGTILTMALAVIAAAARTTDREKTADIFREALLDQMTRLDGRVERGTKDAS